MAGAFGKSSTVEVGTRYNSLGLQSSQQGLPIPIAYGTAKTSGNLIWYGDFKAHKHKETSGGKGGGGVTTVSYTYTCAVAIGIGEGPVSSIGKAWKADGATTVSALNLSVFSGDESQEPWGYLTTNHPDEALYYPGIAYLASDSFDLGSSNNLPQMWFQVSGTLAGTGVIDGSADPAQVIEDFLTNDRYGCNFPAEKIDFESLYSLPSSYQRYCGVNGIGFSMAIKDAKPAREHLAEWLELTNSAAVWSGEKLKILPYGDAPMAGYGFQFTPVLTICAELDDDDFHHDEGESPVKITRADSYDCYNEVKLQVLDKDNEYNTAICDVKDQASIEEIGVRPRNQISAEFIPSPTAGMMAAELIKNRWLFVKNEYRFRLSWEHARLEPMDLVTLTSATMGLSKKPVRIKEITEDEAGLLEVVADEFVEGSQWSVQYPTQGGGGYVGDRMVDPGAINTPFIFEPPASVIGTANPAIWMIVSGGASAWGGARVWASTDGGENYSAVGVVSMGAITGSLSSSISSSGNQIDVDISECDGTLESVTAEEATLGRSALLVGGEVIAYTTATLTAANQYTLSGLIRGMYGTMPIEHEQGARIAYLGASIFKFTIPNTEYYGKTIYLKFTSFNIYGAAEQGLDEVIEYAYAITGDASIQEVNIHGSVSGKPGDGAVIMSYIAPQMLVIPSDLVGSVATAGTAPTSSAVFSIRKNGVEFATASVEVSGAVAFSGSGASLEIGDVLSIVAPSPQDAALSDVAFLIKAKTK